MDERERLVEIMNSHGLNAKQLSVRLGVSAGTISNIIGGRNKPSHEFLKSIALTFPQISRDWLFMGEGDMRKPGSETSTADSEPNLFTSLELSPLLFQFLHRCPIRHRSVQYKRFSSFTQMEPMRSGSTSLLKACF